MKKLPLAALAAASLVLAAASPAAAATTSVYLVGTGTPVAGATASLDRQAKGVDMGLRTLDLPAGHVVTVWWFVFNHPEYCTHGFGFGQCGPNDLAPNGGDPSVTSSMVYATATTVGGAGRAGFDAHLKTNVATRAVFGPGLVNPIGAEIHIGLRDDGLDGQPGPFIQFTAFQAS